MNVGREIIREQLFFRKELRERVYWFIKLRWLAGGAGVAALCAAWAWGLAVPRLSIGAVVLFVLLYNGVFVAVGRRLEASQAADTGRFQAFAHAQITLDLLALYALIFLTGGLASPLRFFVIFHVILAGILLPPRACVAYAVAVLCALSVFLGLPRWVPGWLPQAGLFPWHPEGDQLVPYATFALGVLIAVYLVTSVRRALWQKGRELMKVSLELDLSNTKLTLLYEMIKEVGSHTNLHELMDSATRNAARIMGVKACSIKLLDPYRECLRFASTFGLSEDYLSKDCISVARSAINRRIIEGSVVSIGHIAESSYFQYPEDIRKEGITSMMCLPLKVGEKVLGVFCVYSTEAYFFREADAGFFSLMTDLTAIAMETLNREAARTWFLNKAAHQLRSPLGAIQSMVQLLGRGYLGPLHDKQREMLGRCEKRIEVLREVVNDLLKLAAGRGDVLPPRLAPVDARTLLASVTPLFQGQAMAKGVAFEVEADDATPTVLGQEGLLDDLFSNLISNALKYTPAGGRVAVHLGPHPSGAVAFEVKDTGIGIAEEDIPRLFTDFFRAENARNMVEEGTGLGLSIVRRTLDMLDGTVSVESHPGKGSRFECLLPCAPKATPAAPAS